MLLPQTHCKHFLFRLNGEYVTETIAPNLLLARLSVERGDYMLGPGPITRRHWDSYTCEETESHTTIKYWREKMAGSLKEIFDYGYFY